MNPLSGVQPFFTVTVIFFEYIFWYIFPFDLLDSCCIPRSIAVHALAAEAQSHYKTFTGGYVCVLNAMPTKTG